MELSGDSWLGWDPVDMLWDYWIFVGFGERGEKHFGELEGISLNKVKGRWWKGKIKQSYRCWRI